MKRFLAVAALAAFDLVLGVKLARDPAFLEMGQAVLLMPWHMLGGIASGIPCLLQMLGYSVAKVCSVPASEYRVRCSFCSILIGLGALGLIACSLGVLEAEVYENGELISGFLLGLGHLSKSFPDTGNEKRWLGRLWKTLKQPKKWQRNSELMPTISRGDQRIDHARRRSARCGMIRKVREWWNRQR